MPNIMRWTHIAVNEKHENMIDCMLRILTAIGRNPPSEFSCYLSELLDLLLKSDKCQDLYSKHVGPLSFDRLIFWIKTMKFFTKKTMWFIEITHLTRSLSFHLNSDRGSFSMIFLKLHMLNCSLDTGVVADKK